MTIYLEFYDLFPGVIGIGLDQGYKRIRYQVTYPSVMLYRKHGTFALLESGELLGLPKRWLGMGFKVGGSLGRAIRADC